MWRKKLNSVAAGDIRNGFCHSAYPDTDEQRHKSIEVFRIRKETSLLASYTLRLHTYTHIDVERKIYIISGWDTYNLHKLIPTRTHIYTISFWENHPLEFTTFSSVTKNGCEFDERTFSCAHTQLSDGRCEYYRFYISYLLKPPSFDFSFFFLRGALMKNIAPFYDCVSDEANGSESYFPSILRLRACQILIIWNARKSNMLASGRPQDRKSGGERNE